MFNLKKIKNTLGMISIISCIMIFCSISVSAAKITPTEARNSVVTVVRDNGAALGSGFAIGQYGKPVEYIVTNNHIVRGEWGNTTATVYFSMAADQKMLANVYYYDEAKDIAILKLPQATNERKALILCPMKYVNLNDNFAALGYPGNQESDWPKYSVDDITITKGGVKKTDRVKGLDVYALDLLITNGNSGGPLINSSGEVVGINTFGINNENYAIAIDELLSIINTDKIPVSIHRSPLWIYLIIGGAILLAIIALVLILAFKKKSEHGADQVESQHSQSYYGQSSGGQQRKKSPVASVIAIGGILNGRKFTLNGSVKMGRDSTKCKIVFPVNTQGVSGVHCEITFDGSVCYLKDLNSSYGTFTMDGKKIAPNVPTILKSGDRFYLASPTNTFEVNF